MDIKYAEFLLSCSSVSQCPTEKKHEYAFIGRSNVGKSSLINMLTNHKGLAKTSSTPGKTQLINFFEINKSWTLVDLPGYGYAKVSKSIRDKFEGMIKNYILKRENLICLFVLLDSRIPPQKIDIEFMEWLGQKGVPFIMVFTKIDKISSSELTKNLAAYKGEMAKKWEMLPQIIATSAETGLGKAEILGLIGNYNQTVKL